MPKPIGGKVFVKVDGEQVLVRGNITSNIGQQLQRETVTGVDRVHGFKEMAIAPYLQCDVTETPEFPLSRMNAVDDATITAELADGRVLILRNAWHVGEADRNPEEGQITMRFEGLSGEEQG